MRCSRNAVVFNIPDKVALNSVRNTLLSNCGLNVASADCIRLRKKHQKYSCPVLFRFESESQAATFINGQSHLINVTQYKSLRITKDRTPLERRCAAEGKSITLLTMSSDKSRASIKRTERRSSNLQCTWPAVTEGVKSTFLEAVSSKTNPFGNCNSPPTAAPENIVDLDQTPEAVVLQIPRNIQTPIIKTADLSNVQSHAEDRSNPDTKHSSTRGASRCVSTFGTPIKPTYSNRNKRGGFRRHQNKAELIRPGPVCKTTIPGLVVKPIQTQAPFRGGCPYQQPNLNNVRQIPCPFNPMILAQVAFLGQH
jgi:hypothetical protein